MFNSERFRSNLLRLRTEAGKKQKQMAQEMGVTDVSISRWENGEREPNITNLCALADYFGVTLDELVGREV